MNDYEMVTLLHPRLDDDGVGQVSAWMQERIGMLGGETVQVNTWGRRKLAYLVKKQDEATYVQYDFKMTGTQVPEFERFLRLNENILRHLVVRK